MSTLAPSLPDARLSGASTEHVGAGFHFVIGIEPITGLVDQTQDSQTRT